jgi:N-acetylneuraminic acid mutarotase
MTTERQNQTATLLLNGKVLVVGGVNNGEVLVNAELYDPATGNWTATTPMKVAREFHTATLLPDGKVLVAGGLDNSGSATNSAELYDPVTQNWTLTGKMTTAHATHTAIQRLGLYESVSDELEFPG